MFIDSPHNPRIQALRELHTTRGRKKTGLFLLEGPHLLEALLNADVWPEEVYAQPERLQRTVKGKQLLALLQDEHILAGGRVIEVSERVMEALGEVEASQGVICVAPMATFAAERLRGRREKRERAALLVLDSLADPGNMGMLLRTALAADVSEVLMTVGCVDCYGPKVVRAAAGAHMALPIEPALAWSAIEEKVERHCGGERRAMLAEAGSEHVYYEEDLRRPFALVIGNEAHGPSREARALATMSVAIPLANGVESLNAAMAAGIMLYEAVRQRQ